MPYATSKRCRNKNCVNLTKAPSGFCPDCEVKYNKGKWSRIGAKGTPAERGYDQAWARLRKMYIRAHPMCELCGQLAEIVHHKVRIREGGDRLNEDNLQSLCKQCHDKGHKG
jgi:5-methylcytosine-specific restriction enzyme A